MPTNESQRQIIPTNTRSVNDRLFHTNTRSVNDRLCQLTQGSDRLCQLTQVNDRLFQLTQGLLTTDYSN